MTATPPQDSDQLEQAELRQYRTHAEVVISAGETLPTQAEPTKPEEQLMSNCKCGAKLRANNTKGACYRCSAGKTAAPGAEGSTTAPRAHVGTLSPRKQFKAVTAALGIDGEALLDGFRSGWLARIKATVQKAGPDQDDDFELPAKT